MRSRIVLVLVICLLSAPAFAQVNFTGQENHWLNDLGRQWQQDHNEQMRQIEEDSRFRSAQRRQERLRREEERRRVLEDQRRELNREMRESARERRAEHRQWERDFWEDLNSQPIEPGHIPYNCGHIVGNARARADCQRDWEASDPNDYLNYGR